MIITNKSLLVNDISNQSLDNYINDIEVCGNNLYKRISNLYLKEIELLLKDLGRKLDVYSIARLTKILKEIIYKNFMDRSKTTIESAHVILKNNVSNNSLYLDNMNKSSIKGR